MIFYDNLAGATQQEIEDVNVGDEATDKLLQELFKKAVDGVAWTHEGNNKAIELMAGYGRNYPIYKDLFKEKILVDGS